MFIRFFRSSSPSAFIILPLIALFIWALGFRDPSIVPGRHAMPLYELISGPFISYPWLGVLAGLTLVVAEAFLINYILNENEVMTRPSFLPALFYLLLMSSYAGMLGFYPLIPANLFLLLAIQRLLSSYRKDKAFSNAFDAGLLMAVATLFYFPYVFLLPLLGAGLIILRPFNWREWIISFFGVLTPYLFTFTFYFWNDGMDYLLFDKMFFPVKTVLGVIAYPFPFYLLTALIAGILVLAFGKLLGKMGTGPQRTKKGIILFVWAMLFSSMTLLIAPEISARYFAVLAIPATVFYSFLFLHTRRIWLGEILFLCFLGAIILQLAFHYF